MSYLRETDHVEEWEVLLLLDQVAQLTPLSLVGVDTGRVLKSARFTCIEM
jgi:hypothetical protein